MKNDRTAFILVIMFIMAGSMIIPWNLNNVCAADKVKSTEVTEISAINQGFQVKWKKVKGCYGYELSYGTESDFSGAETIQIVGYDGRISQTVKRLEGNKKYYVRVRVLHYNREGTGDDIIPSSWSAKKAVKTKSPKIVKIKVPTKIKVDGRYNYTYHYNSHGLVDRISTFGGSRTYEYTYYEDGTIKTLTEHHYYDDEDDSDDDPDDENNGYPPSYSLNSYGVPLEVSSMSLNNYEYYDEGSKRLWSLEVVGNNPEYPTETKCEYLKNGLLNWARFSEDSSAVKYYKQYDKKGRLTIICDTDFGINTYKYSMKNGKVYTRKKYKGSSKTESVTYQKWKTVKVYTNSIRSINYLAPFLNITEDLDKYPCHIYNWK